MATCLFLKKKKSTAAIDWLVVPMVCLALLVLGSWMDGDFGVLALIKEIYTWR